MYKGHKNYNCCNVSLYIDNEYCLHMVMVSLFRRGLTKDLIAVELMEYMIHLYGTHTPDNVRITFSGVREHLRNLTRKDFK